MGLIVVTGPPAAGKSSWIKAHAKPTDIVFDFDVLTLAISGPGARAQFPSKVAEDIAHRMRFAGIQEAKSHLSKTDVYLIHTMPQEKALAEYRRLQARIVEVDPGKDVVMERIESMRRPGMKRVATRWYANRRATQPAVTQRVATQASRKW